MVSTLFNFNQGFEAVAYEIISTIGSIPILATNINVNNTILHHIKDEVNNTTIIVVKVCCKTPSDLYLVLYF